jgi:hypothetical protein
MEDTMGEFDFLEPIPKTAISVKLPSRGVLYPKDHPASSGKLTLTPMTMLEESLLMNEAGLDQAVDRILKRCVTETVDVNTLIGADKFFLFIMLRAITYGSEYTFSWVCAHATGVKPCGHTNTVKVNIPDSFRMKYLTEEDKEPFQVTLPDNGRQISFRLLRGVDEPHIEAYLKEIKQDQENGIDRVDTSLAFRLVSHIIEVDGKSVKKAPREKIMAFVNSWSAKDRQYLQQKIAFYTPGLDTLLKVKCDKCGHSHEMEMPYTVNFFRAVNSPDEGEPEADQI